MILVDFDMLAHRCYHAMDHLKTTTGIPTGMEYGCFKILKGLSKRLTNKDNQQIILCFEGGSDDNIKSAYYKANRTKQPDSFYERKNILAEALRNIYFYAIEYSQEADQVMFSIAKNTIKESVLIYTNDSDLFQAISSTTLVVRSHEGQLYYWGVEELFEKFKVHPYQYAFYKILTGDKSDNLFGIPRFRKELAAEIARRTTNHFMTRKGLEPLIALSSALGEFYHRLSPTMQERTEKFVKKDLKINFELIYLTPKHVTIHRMKGGQIQKYLEKLEIKSLSFNDEKEF